MEPIATSSVFLLNLIQITPLLVSLVTVGVLIWTLIIFRKDVILRTRPWIGITSIEFDIDLEYPIINIYFQNIGNLPALDLSLTVKLIPGKKNQPVSIDIQRDIAVFPEEPNMIGYSDENLPGLDELVSSDSEFKVCGIFKYSYGNNNYQTEISADFSYRESEELNKGGIISGHVDWENISAT